MKIRNSIIVAAVCVFSCVAQIQPQLPRDAGTIADFDAGTISLGPQDSGMDAGGMPGTQDAGSVPDASVNMPQWAKDLAVGEWKEVPNSSLKLVPPTVTFTIGDTGPSSKIDAWTGLAIDPLNSTVYSVANGGHNDWPGNEVNAIVLSDENPQWIERRASSAQSQVVRDQDHYLDGTPTSRHSYYGVEFIAPLRRVVLLGGYMYGDGNFTRSFDAYDTMSNAYSHPYPNIPTSLAAAPGAPLVLDPATSDIYGFGDYEVHRWNSAENQWEQKLTSTPIYGFNSAAAFDSKRRRILILGGDRSPSSSVGYTYDIAQNKLSPVTFTGESESVVDHQQAALMFVPALDAYFYRNGSTAGASVYKIDAATMAISKLAVGGGSAVPAPVNGLWKRWLYAPQLGGAVYVPAYDENVWFLRLH